MAQILEMLMLILFGLSWPFNIVKSINSRTAKGKSLLFEILVIVGYSCGLAGKIIAGNVTYVVVFYIIDLLMVATDALLTVRNMRLDRDRQNDASACAS